MSGGEGKDTFIYSSGSPHLTSFDVILDFQTGTDTDVIDFSDVLSNNYNPNTDDIDDFIKVIDNGNNTVIEFYRNFYVDASLNMPTYVTLQGVSGVDLSTMIDNGNIVLE